MKIFVTGANGFAGSYIVKQLLEEGYEVFASSRKEDLSSFSTYNNYRFIQVDFTDAYSLHDAFEFVKPEVVVHCGAMSKPDDCEENQAAAFDVNVFGTVQLLLNAEEHQAFFVHLSSDFIFNGAVGMHREDDKPDPLSYYGKTKLQAEEAVQEYPYNWAIVRTVFVYGKTLHGRDSFIAMIAQKLKDRQPYKVVSDQERTPTYAGDLAKGVAAIIRRKATGVYHLCGKDVVTPYEMAMQTAAFLNIAAYQITPVATNELNEVARRPLKSGLSIEKARRELGYEPVSFEEGLRKTLNV